MKTRTLILVLLLAVIAGLSGCRRNLVSAAPPSVVTPQPIEPAPLPQIEVPLPLTLAMAGPPLVPLPLPPQPAAPAVVAPAPRPRTPVAAEPAPAAPEPEPPVISPVLTPAALADTQRRTNDDIRTSERNLQLAYGKQLNAAQRDLAEKVRGFLSQAHEAMRAGDWFRARNLAEKARVLSLELTNSF